MGLLPLWKSGQAPSPVPAALLFPNSWGHLPLRVAVVFRTSPAEVALASGSETHSASSHACLQANHDLVSWLWALPCLGILSGIMYLSSDNRIPICQFSFHLSSCPEELLTTFRPFKPEVLPWSCHCPTGSRGSAALEAWPVAGVPTHALSLLQSCFPAPGSRWGLRLAWHRPLYQIVLLVDCHVLQIPRFTCWAGLPTSCFSSSCSPNAWLCSVSG